MRAQLFRRGSRVEKKFTDLGFMTHKKESSIRISVLQVATEISHSDEFVIFCTPTLHHSLLDVIKVLHHTVLVQLRTLVILHLFHFGVLHINGPPSTNLKLSTKTYWFYSKLQFPYIVAGVLFIYLVFEALLNIRRLQAL